LIAFPTLKRASKSARTLQAEGLLELGDCLYFFASHACPSFGDLVLAYSAEMADTDQGSATPFDTGGLAHDFIQADTLDGGESRNRYNRRHAVELHEWRVAAAAHIHEYFSSRDAYVLGERPTRNDDSGRLLHPGNDDRRAWTWEVRIWRDHPIEQALQKAWASADFFEGIRHQLRRSTSREAQRCGEMIATRTLSSAPPGEPVHPLAEQEIATWT
jgi:hypothetical protein